MKLVCRIREIYKGLSELESEFLRVFGNNVNEMVVICSLSEGRLSASEISLKTGMTASHLSKVMKLVENKGFVVREFGEMDKRQMYFELSNEGIELLRMVDEVDLHIPELLRPMF